MAAVALECRARGAMLRNRRTDLRMALDHLDGRIARSPLSRSASDPPSPSPGSKADRRSRGRKLGLATISRRRANRRKRIAFRLWARRLVQFRSVGSRSAQNLSGPSEVIEALAKTVRHAQITTAAPTRHSRPATRSIPKQPPPVAISDADTGCLGTARRRRRSAWSRLYRRFVLQLLLPPIGPYSGDSPHTRRAMQQRPEHCHELSWLGILRDGIPIQSASQPMSRFTTFSSCVTKRNTRRGS